jgi:hypothetical protein
MKNDVCTINVHADVENVSLSPFGDIGNVSQRTSVDLDDKNELIKARRRAAYRKRKEEAAKNQPDENLPVQTISGKPITLSYAIHFQRGV